MKENTNHEPGAIVPGTIGDVIRAWGTTPDEWGLLGPVEFSDTEAIRFVLTSNGTWNLERHNPEFDEWYVALAGLTTIVPEQPTPTRYELTNPSHGYGEGCPEIITEGEIDQLNRDLLSCEIDAGLHLVHGVIRDRDGRAIYEKINDEGQPPTDAFELTVPGTEGTGYPTLRIELPANEQPTPRPKPDGPEW